MAEKKEAPVMLTSAKIAEKIGVSVGKVKKAIEELGIQPDMKKAGCAYYSDSTCSKIQKKIG
jgi:hypothetical protein